MTFTNLNLKKNQSTRKRTEILVFFFNLFLSKKKRKAITYLFLFDLFLKRRGDENKQKTTKINRTKFVFV